MEKNDNYAQQISEVQKKILDIKERWPAHSVKPEMVNELDDLEDLLDKLLELSAEEND